MKKLLLTASTALAFSSLLIVTGVRGQAPPPPPPPGGAAPTATATVTPSPTATPLPTATATPIPLTLNVKLAHRSVKPGTSQKVTVTTLGGANVVIFVTYPNKQRDQITAAANGSGQATYSYMQPGGVVSGKNHTVVVAVKVTGAGQSKASTKKYTVG